MNLKLKTNIGFSLFEVTIGLLIGSVVIVGILSSVVDFKKIYFNDSNRSNLQQDLRISSSIITGIVSQTGKYLPSNFPAIELVNDDINGDELIIRKGRISGAPKLCQAISSNDIYITNSTNTLGCVYSDNIRNVYNEVKDLRVADGGTLKAYIYDSNSKSGELITLANESDNGTNLILVKNNSISGTYTVGSTAIYIIDEFKFKKMDDEIVMIKNGNTSSPQVITSDVKDFNVDLYDENDNLYQSYNSNSSVNWSSLKDVRINLGGEVQAIGESKGANLKFRNEQKSRVSINQGNEKLTLEAQTCGNGEAEGTEECDDGNNVDNDGCYNCALPDCGNSVIELGETCDDGNNVASDGCSPTCAKEVICGDGVTEGSEQCDDANSDPADGCHLCLKHICGNNVQELGETCDDGNTVSGDGCSETCGEQSCGDGVRASSEDCDPGIDSHCNTDCTWNCDDAMLPVVNYGTTATCSGVIDAIKVYCDPNYSLVTTGVTMPYTSKLIYPTTESYYTTTKTERKRGSYSCLKFCCGNQCHQPSYIDTITKTHESTGYVQLELSNECGTIAYNLPVNFFAQKVTKSARYLLWNSPVSLLLPNSELKPKDINPSLVKFKLSEDQKQPTTLWYGTANSPLLIYDPKRKGKVKDGRDLFGTWAFGKKWSSGYDALASLDKDKNGFLEGAELSSIRLWSDENSNAKVDESEIYDLLVYDIVKIDTSLKVMESNKLYNTNFIINEKGYAYREDGKVKYGSSFDWYVPSDLSVSSWKNNIENLKKDGYSLYQWKQSDLDYGINKINGYLAIKKVKDQIEGYEFNSVYDKDEKGFKQFSLAQYKLEFTKDKDIANLFFNNNGEKITFQLDFNSLSPINVVFDKRDHPLSKLMPGVKFDVYSSKLILEPVSVIPEFYN